MPGKVIRFAFSPECFCSLAKKVKTAKGVCRLHRQVAGSFSPASSLCCFFFLTPTESLYVPFLLSLPGAGSPCLSLRVFSAIFSPAAPPHRAPGNGALRTGKWQTPALLEATAFFTRTSGLHFRDSNYTAHTAFWKGEVTRSKAQSQQAEALSPGRWAAGCDLNLRNTP